VRVLSPTSEGWLCKRDVGAWAVYIACKHNPERCCRFKSLATEAQRRIIREAYELDRDRDA